MHACEEELKLCEARKMKILGDMRRNIISAVESVDSSIQMDCRPNGPKRGDGKSWQDSNLRAGGDIVI